MLVLTGQNVSIDLDFMVKRKKWQIFTTLSTDIWNLINVLPLLWRRCML